MSFWRKSNGKLICNDQGRLIYCDHCPCEAQPIPCNDWLVEVSGQPVLYNISLTMTANHYVKWHLIYGEEEDSDEEYYEGELYLTMTATMSNIPASTIIGGSVSFQVNSVNGFESSKYEYHSTGDYILINENTSTVSSIIGGGCPTQDPLNQIPDDNMHGFSFECNEAGKKLKISISTGVGSCHGKYEEHYESPYGSETMTYLQPVSVSVVLMNLNWPDINCVVENYQGLGYILKSSSVNLSYNSGDSSDDNYQHQSYTHNVTFTAIIPGDNN